MVTIYKQYISKRFFADTKLNELEPFSRVHQGKDQKKIQLTVNTLAMVLLFGLFVIAPLFSLSWLKTTLYISALFFLLNTKSYSLYIKDLKKRNARVDQMNKEWRTLGAEALKNINQLERMHKFSSKYGKENIGFQTQVVDGIYQGLVDAFREKYSDVWDQREGIESSCV